MRALVIDDMELVLDGMQALLQVLLPDVSLDKTPSVSTAVQLATSIPYELILLDWHLLDADGAAIDGREFIEALRHKGCSTPIIVVSGDDRIDWSPLVLELGLAGVVPKFAAGTVLADAIQVAMRGGIYLPAQVRERRAGVPYRPAGTQRPLEPKERYPDLTPRQCEVFDGMIRGNSDKQIARDLGISESTVKTHVRSILSVVGVRRRGAAVFEATGGGKPGA